MRRFYCGLFFALALMVPGCRSTYRAFDGDASDAVVLHVGEEFRVTMVDGKPVPDPLSIELLPGEHVLRHFFVHRTFHEAGSRRANSEMGTIKFHARAGHVYRMHYRMRLVEGRKLGFVAVSEAPVTRPADVKIVSFGTPDSMVNSGHPSFAP